MASTPATNAIGVELQAAGENLNTWGDPKLNNALQILVNLAHGWKAWTINGNYTVSETNYSTTNDTENAFIKLVAGTVTAAFNVTVPGRAKRWVMWNATLYAATVKLSATTGVVIPAGGFALIATDGSTDVYNVGPTHAGTSTQSTSTNAYALWGAVEAAIAAAGTLTPATVRVSAADTTSAYLQSKQSVSASGDVTAVYSITNPSGNEVLALTIVHTPYWNAPRALSVANSPITALDRDILVITTSATAGNPIAVTLPASGRVWVIDKSGNAPTNNITLTPAGGDTITVGTIDSAYFGSVYIRTGTNWDMA